MRRKPDELIPFELDILDAALSLQQRQQPEFHAYSLAKVIKKTGDHQTLTAYGTLYRALHRLERAGLIEASWEDPAAAEQERRPRRRLYRVTATGEQAFARARAAATSRSRVLNATFEAP